MSRRLTCFTALTTLTEMSEESKEPKGLLPAMYADLLSPSAKEIGGTVHNVVRLALRPLNGLVLSVDQAAELAGRAIAERIRKYRIPENKVVTPAPELYGAVVVSLQTAAADPDLRELFINLLTTAMVADSSANAHPAYVQILRQLTPHEARLVQHFRFSPPVPMIAFRGVLRKERVAHSGGPLLSYFEIELPNVTALGETTRCDDYGTMSRAIDNLARLGVIRVDRPIWPHSEEEYADLESHSVIAEALATLSEAGVEYKIEPELTYRRLEIRPTSFGENFISACATPMVQLTLDELL